MKHKRIRIGSILLLTIALIALTATSVTTFSWLAAIQDIVQVDQLRGNAHAAYFNGGNGTAPAAGTTKDDYKEPGTQYPSYAYDNGNSQGPYQIDNAIQLYNFAWLQYLGYFNRDDDDVGDTDGVLNQVYFVLTNDIDLSTGDYEGLTLPPVGDLSNPFLGNFNGNGYTIKGLQISNVKNELENEGIGVGTATSSAVNIPTTALSNGNLKDPAEVVGFFGVVGETDNTPNTITVNGQALTYDSSIIAVTNVVIEDASIKTQTTNSLAGIAAGYVNGSMSDVKVVGGSITSSATTPVGGIPTTNLSDYGAVGYCTEPFRGTNEITTVVVYDPQTMTSGGQGSAAGQGNNWGGSVEMQTMYNDLLNIYTTTTNTSNTYPTAITVTHHADGTVTEEVTANGTGNLTVNNYPIKVTEVDDNGDVIASYAIVQRDQTSDFMYLYGEKTTNTYTAQITDVYEKNAFYIYHENDSTHNLSFNGTAYSDAARASATKWAIEDGKIYTIINNTRYYVTKDANNLLAFTSVAAGATVPATITTWTVTDTDISADGYYLCYKNNTWQLLLQDRVLITDDLEEGSKHYMTVVNGTIQNTMVKEDAASWTRTPISDNENEPEFYLSTQIGEHHYYLTQRDGELALEMDPAAPATKWKSKDATETEKAKIYTLIPGNTDGEGYALYYDDTDDVRNWALTDFSEVAAGSGQGHSFGNTIDMAAMYSQLNNLENNYAVRTYDATRRIIIDNNNHANDSDVLLSTGTIPSYSYTFTNGSQTITPKYYYYENYGSVAFSDRASTERFKYLTDLSDDYQTNVVKIEYSTETEDAFYISSQGYYLNTNDTGSAIVTTTPSSGNTKWRITNDGYIRTEILGEWYYLNGTNALSVSKTPITEWTKDDTEGTLQYSFAGDTYSLSYDNAWKVTPIGSYYYITDNNGHYLSATANSIANVGTEGDSVKWAVSSPNGSTTTISTYIGGTLYYLQGNGMLGVGTGSFTWNLDNGVCYTTVQNIRHNLIYDGGWKLVPASGYKITDGNGHFLTASTTTVGNASGSDAVVWQLSSASGNTQIFTILNGQKYYLRYNNGLIADTTAATWNRNVNSFYVTSGGRDYYLTYDNEWTVTRLDYFTIHDGSGNYLRVTGANSFENGNASTATHFYFATENGANSSGRVFCIVGGNTYYLYNNNGSLQTTTTQNTGTQWQNDGNSLYVTSGNTTYALQYDSGWKIKTIIAGYYITDGTNYLTVSGTTIGNTTDINNATVFVFSNTGANPSGTIQVAGTNNYLRNNAGTLQVSTTSTTWTNSNNRLYSTYTTGGWFSETHTSYLGFYSNSWQLSDDATTVDSEIDGYYINRGNNYLTLNANGEITNATSASAASVWYRDGNYLYTDLNGSRRYLNNSGTTALQIGNSGSTSWNYSTGNYIRYGTNQNRYISYRNNAWQIYNSNNTTYRASLTVRTETINIVSQVAAVDTTRPTVQVATGSIEAPAMDLNTYSSSGTVLSFSGPHTETVTFTETTAQLFERTEYTEPVGETYYPLAVDATGNNTNPYETSKENTGYVLSGYSDSLGDIRVSQYAKSDITNSVNNTERDGQIQATSVYTRNAGGVGGVIQLTQQYINANYHKFSDVIVGGETEKGSLSKMNDIINGTTEVYGLHFMNAEISTNNLAVLPHAYILGHHYDDYEMPKDAIDFQLKEKGYINFFAGTYFANNNSFFSLHKIERYTEDDAEVVSGTKKENDIKSIKEILEIFGDGNESHPYVYKLTDGTTTTYESWTFYPSGKVKTHSTYQAPPSGYSSLFDTSWITNNNINYQSQYSNSVFYFEIPADIGEYALGSVPDGTGAYLMYLDIGTSGTALKPEGNAHLEDVTVDTPEVSHIDAGVITYQEPGTPRDSDLKTLPTYYPLAWNEGHTAVAETNTGYVISGANTNSNPPGDIRVSQYNKQGGTGNWTDIRNSLTNAGILNNGRVYTIVDGTQTTVTAYGIGNQRTMQYARVSEEMNDLLRGNPYVYGLHFMQAAISTENTVTAPKAVINGETYTNYVMPQDCIDFRVAQKGKITFMGGTYFSGSNGTRSFFSLHQILRDSNQNITAIKELSEIYGDGNRNNRYVYRYVGDNNYYYSDGTLIGANLPANYTRLMTTSDFSATRNLTTNSVYYFEIPVDSGEFALGSSSSDGAYLIYLDIAANAQFNIKTTITEVTEQYVHTLNYPLGVAFADSASSTVFNTNGHVDPEKSAFTTIPMDTSAGTTTFSMNSSKELTVTNTTSASSLAGFEAKCVPLDGKLTVNGTEVEISGKYIITEKVTDIDTDSSGTTTTTVTITTQTTENGVTTTTVEQTVTTSVGGAAGTTETITPAPTYDGHTLLPTDYTLDTPATASSILEYTIRGAGLTQTIERSGELNMVGTEKTVTKTETVNGTEKQVVYTVYDVVKQDGEGATPAGTYTITITGTAGSYTADVTDIDTDFTFTMNSTAINAVNTYTITVSQ